MAARSFTPTATALIQIARKYFERAGVVERISIHTGDALELLSEQKQEFDVILMTWTRKTIHGS